MEKNFAAEEASLKLGIIGNPDDKVDSPRSTEDLMATLDSAFNQDLGFTFKSMINVLQILTHWPNAMPNITVSTFYSATDEEIREIALHIVSKIKHEEVMPILNFLTLKSSEVIRLIGQEEACSDLPVWEHKKRYARYNLRPLIKIGNKYYWGPYSTMRSGIIWSGSLTNAALPTDMQSQRIREVISSEKKLIEDALEAKALEIVKRYTPHASLNVELYKVDKLAGHPQNLGDYDVLAFYPEKNTLINIECKDITPPYCLKDAKTLRETIFGEQGKNEGHFVQINKRQTYLAMHFEKITKALEWPIDIKRPPRTISIYLTRTTYWWTRFPPKDVDTIFLQVDMLSKYIETM